MKTAVECSLFVSAAAGLAYLFLPSKKAWSKCVFLAAITIFLVVSLCSNQHLFKATPGAALDQDQAELSLKMLSAYRSTQGKLSTGDLHNAISAVQFSGAPISQMLVKQVYSEVVESLTGRLSFKGKAVEPSQVLPKDLNTLADIAIVCGDSDDTATRPKLIQSTHLLSLSSKPQMRQLGEAICSIYSAGNISKTQANQFEKTLQTSLPSGWYRNHALEQLFKASGQSAAYEQLKASTEAESLRFAHLAIILLLFMTIAALTGIVAILIFFATDPKSAEANAPMSADPETPWSLTTTYGVLIGWLVTQLLVQSIISAGAKLQIKHLMQGSSVSTATVTMILYLVMTTPALLYIWLFACRPFHLRFTDAIRLKINTAYASFLQLITFGVLTWCSAIPAVLGSQLLSLRLFSSQGSSNPVLSLVRDAAHSPSVLPVTIYYIILGVLAPVAEEALFRGFIYSSLRTKLGKITAAVISAALFSTAHLDPGAFISLFTLGFIFALVRERYKSIVPSIIAHGMWNCATFTLVLVLFGGS